MAVYDVSGTLLKHLYLLNGDPSIFGYDVNGNVIFPTVDYSKYSVVDYLNVNIPSTQGFDIYNNVIFQFTTPSLSNADKMATVDANNGIVINANIDAVSSHGDSASFSNEFYSISDEYPLLYVTSDTNPGKVYVNRVTENSSELIKTYMFPLEQAGYYSALCLDTINKIMYMVGYTENMHATDDGGNNKTLISLWDYTNNSLNSDGTYTPRFIRNYERPFIVTMQGQQFHDNMLWISSAHYEGSGLGYTGNIFALNADDGELLFTISLDTNKEIEGISFISDNEMICGLQGGLYKKIIFETR